MFNKIATMTLAFSLLFSCSENKQEDKRKDDVKLADNEMFLLIGTYTSKEGSEGVYVHRFDTETGTSDSISLAEAINPSYLAISSDEKFVYAVGENNKDEAGVYSFSFDKKNGSLNPINFQSTLSSGPCYI